MSQHSSKVIRIREDVYRELMKHGKFQDTFSSVIERLLKAKDVNIEQG